ncbi:MAG: hypothetical protein CO079_09450, partial [Nitrosopumilales archaeon CG_4_9_14_0_8_um_filter_34_10]
VANQNDETDKIKIYSTDDEKLKFLGKILNNDSSREILLLLIEKEMTANEIAIQMKLSLPLVLYHINQMIQSGIVIVSKTFTNSKNQPMKYYSAKSGIVILPEIASIKAKESKSFSNSLKTIMKFAVIGIVSFVSWVHVKSQQKELPPSDDSFDYVSPQNYDFLDVIISEPIIIPLLVIIVGLSILFVLEKRKKV